MVTAATADPVAVAGHSAGGQYVNRYAAGTPIASLMANRFGLQVRFVVANPLYELTRANFYLQISREK